MTNSQKYPMFAACKKAVAFMKSRGDKGVALYMEMGTTKTRCAIKWLAWLFAQGQRLTYVIAPLSAMHVWVEEWNLWATYPVTFIDLHDTGSVGLRAAKELADAGYPVICLVNYEKAWQLGHKYIERTIQKGARSGETVKEYKQVDTAMDDIDWDIGILDEVTAIKNRGSKVSQFFRNKMKQKTRYRAILTGSAYTKRPLDVWAQIMYCCSDYVFPTIFEEFCGKYAIPNPEYHGQYIGYTNLDDLTLCLSKVAVLLKKEDVVELPPVIHQTRLVPLSARSRKLYDELKEEMYAEFEALEKAKEVEYEKLRELYETEPDDAVAAKIWAAMEKLKHTAAVTVEHVFARTAKWRQITSGYLIPDNTQETTTINVPGGPILTVDTTPTKAQPVRLGKEKIGALIEVLEERDGKPTVIVVQANEEEAIVAEAIEKHFHVTPKILNGSVKGAETRHNMIADAANDPFFIVKEAVGCRGVDMRFSDCMIFYSHRPMTESYTQMLARNHRGGVKHKSIIYVHILCKNTYDQKIMNILKNDLALEKEIERNWRALFEQEEE
jgi:SNF2 family DNA or RNA helicase